MLMVTQLCTRLHSHLDWFVHFIWLKSTCNIKLFHSQEVVTLLLQYNANVDIFNAEGLAPKHLSCKPEIRELLEGNAYTGS
jgi:hypothetical protein